MKYRIPNLSGDENGEKLFARLSTSEGKESHRDITFENFDPLENNLDKRVLYEVTGRDADGGRTIDEEQDLDYDPGDRPRDIPVD